MAGLSFANDSTKRGLHALPMDWSGGGPGVAIVGLGIEGHSFSKIIADPIFDQWLSRVTLFYLASARNGDCHHFGALPQQLLAGAE